MEPCFSEGQFDRRYALLRRGGRSTPGSAAIRRFVEAIYWMRRSGAQWRFLPVTYGERNSVYQRFARWDDLGVWGRLFDHVADDPAMQSVMIDATVVGARLRRRRATKRRARRAGARRARGGFGTKSHVLVDALGHPRRFRLTSGAAGGPAGDRAAGGRAGSGGGGGSRR